MTTTVLDLDTAPAPPATTAKRRRAVPGWTLAAVAALAGLAGGTVAVVAQQPGPAPTTTVRMDLVGANTLVTASELWTGSGPERGVRAGQDYPRQDLRGAVLSVRTWSRDVEAGGCRISVDGQTVVVRTATAPGASVTCVWINTAAR